MHVTFHRSVNDSMYKAHPNIFDFVQKIQEAQTVTYVKLQSLHLTPKVNVRQRQTFIHNMIQRYTNKEISRLHFFKCVLSLWFMNDL